MLAIITPEETGDKVDHTADTLQLKNIFGDNIYRVELNVEKNSLKIANLAMIGITFETVVIASPRR